MAGVPGHRALIGLLLDMMRIHASKSGLIGLLIMMVMVAALSGCGDDDPTNGTDDSDSAATSVTADDTTAASEDTASASTEAPTTTEETTTTLATTSTTSGPVDDADLPGDAWDGFAAAGDVFSVVGVAHDDELNIRALPDAGSTALTSVAPTADDLVATGRARILPESIWYEVSTGGSTGWANSRFVAFVGGTDDATAEFLDGEPPTTAETMLGLAGVVTDKFASEDPPSRVVQTVAPTVGDLGEVTYDVVGIGDDAVAGYRLHIFATPNEDGESFSLKSIERTYLCSRGVTGELCS